MSKNTGVETMTTIGKKNDGNIASTSLNTNSNSEDSGKRRTEDNNASSLNGNDNGSRLPPDCHERGTPRGPLSATARSCILSLLILVSCIFSSWACNVGIGASISDWILTIFQTILGSTASLLGILSLCNNNHYHQNNLLLLVHPLAWIASIAISIFLGLCLHSTTSIFSFLFDSFSMLGPLGIVVFMLLSSFPQKSNELTESSSSTLPFFILLLQPWSIVALSIVPFTMLVTYILKGSVYFAQQSHINMNETFLPSISVMGATAMVTLGLLLPWHINRSNKYLNLLSKKDSKIMLYTAMALIFTCLINQQNIRLLLPLFMSATVTVLSCALLASVADVWYTVGTGQFWMVSLDTACMGIYFVLPLGLLVYRFVLMHGTQVLGILVHNVAPAFSILSPKDHQEVEAVIRNSCMYLSICLVLATYLGMAMTNALCPMAGYLFGRVYTHGQPNTKTIAICIPWNAASSLLAEYNSDDRWENVVLNVFLSARDMSLGDKALKEAIQEKKHHFVPPTHGEDTSALEDIRESSSVWTHGQYNPLAHWVNASTTSNTTMAHKNNKISLWSHCISDNTSPAQVNEMMNDVVNQHRGGSIIYFHDAHWLDHVVQHILSKDFKVEHLSKVAKDDHAMIV